MNKGIALAAVAALGALGVALYGIGGREGNGGDGACRASVASAAGLKGLATGEVAAFQVANRPVDLSGVVYKDADGQPTTLGEQGGRLRLVNLWATWCAPCRKEMPALDRLQAELGGESFAVLPINVDNSGAEKPRNFLQSIGTANLPLLTDPDMQSFETMKAQGLALGLPVTVLIDGQSCLIGHMNGPAEWDSDEAKVLIRAATSAAGA